MLKAAIRKSIGQDRWSFLSWYRDRFGLRRAILDYRKMIGRRGLRVVPNPIGKGSIFLRPGTTDQLVFDEIFIHGEYDIGLDHPTFIIDAGAHIGLASVFFASKYPRATIIAIEPETSNFEILLQNSKNYPNIRPIQAGLWSKKTHLRIQDVEASKWGFRVMEDSSGNGIPALSISDIMSDFNIAVIDALKMDIEGSECEVLNHSKSWLPSIRTLIIELHDRFQPGCTEALTHALSGFEYEKSASRESIVITNLQRVREQ